jgi:hypothetical protein
MPKKRKNSGSRFVLPKLFIFCEGAEDKSESAYFKRLISQCKIAGNRIDIKVIDTRYNTGRELVKEALNYKEISTDILWIVYDKDGYTKHHEAFIKARDNGVKIAFSSISFEVWILLHFEYTTRPFSCSDDLISYIKKKHHYSYQKSNYYTFDEIKDKLDQATTYAKQLRDYYNEP